MEFISAIHCTVPYSSREIISWVRIGLIVQVSLLAGQFVGWDRLGGIASPESTASYQQLSIPSEP